MKVLHITPSFYPAYTYGGPIQIVYDWCRYLGKQGVEVRVLTTDANGSKMVLEVKTDREVNLADGVRVRYCKRLVAHSVSAKLLILLPSYILWADVVHLSAAYSFPTIPTLLLCNVLKKPVIWSPHGALQRWDGSTRIWLKSMWDWVCMVVAPKQLVLHLTTNEEETESDQQLPGIHTAVIPYGVEIPEKVSHACGDGKFRLLFLGRLHPKKGIENLLAACKILKDNTSITWSLTIAGTGSSQYAETIKARIEKLALSQRVKMLGQIGGEAKQIVFENTDIAVVPSYTENFGMVVAEALAHGVPVIVSKGTPWKRVEEIGCGLWVENDPESLAKAIEQMSRMPLQEMGRRGRQWMKRDFGWATRAEEIFKCYERVLEIEAGNAM